MRVVPPPLSVILLPPSMTSFVPLSLKTFAVDVRVMVVGLGPQSNVMMPPFATAATKASPVQLAGVPVPITIVGFETSSACASAGMGAWPSGLPAGGPSCGFVAGVTVPDVPEVPPLVIVPEEPDVPPLVVPLDDPGAPEVSSLELHPAMAASPSSAAENGNDRREDVRPISPV
jgi:hypothetical protein